MSASVLHGDDQQINMTDVILVHSQFDFMEREGLEAPMSSTNKDGEYQCKKHGSTGTLPYALHNISMFKQLTGQCLDRNSLQPVLRVEEADHSC